MPVASQLGVKAESTYATAVTVDTFYEFVTENIKATPSRVVSRTKRASQRVRRGDRVVPVPNGASGPINMPVLTKGHGKWLLWALGSNSTSGPTDSTYTHTVSIGDLTSDMFTCQVDRPFNPSSTSQAFTWAGGKVTSAEWSLTTGESGFLMATYNCDFATQATGTALASPSYPSGAAIFPWSNATCTIGGVAVELAAAKISLTNALKLDRHYVRGSGTKKEPLENGNRVVKVEATVDFVDLTHYNRVVSSTVAGMQSAFVLTCTGLDLIGTTTYPSITFTCAQVEWDDSDGPAVANDDPIRIKLTGEATFDGTNSALVIAYASADSAI